MKKKKRGSAWAVVWILASWMVLVFALVVIAVYIRDANTVIIIRQIP